MTARCVPNRMHNGAEMGSIAGIFNRTGAPVHRAHISRMMAAMAHRAEGGGETSSVGAVGLGFGRPWDESESWRQTLPVAASSGSLVVTGDLRLDNRLELIRELHSGHHDEREIGDGALVLEAYRRWGRQSPSRLVGAFAFALWDGRLRELFCVRDHLGAKPLHFHLSRDLFAFASEAEAVLAAPGVPRRINERRIADFLVNELEGIDHTSTFYLDVVKLPPAHALVVGPQNHRLARFWRPDPSDELRCASEGEYVEAFRDSLRQSVRACLSSASRPAVMLSGGIDSGTVAAAAVEQLAGSGSPALRTLSAIDDSRDDCKESSCILRSIDLLGTDALTLALSRVPDLGSETCRAVFDCSDPFDSGMTVPALLYEEARRSGSRVVLDGVDGDVVMSVGGAHVAHLARKGRLLQAFGQAAAAAEVRGGDQTPLRRLFGAVAAAFLPDPALRGWRRLRRTSGRVEGAIAASVISPEFADRVDLAARLAELDRQRWFAVSGDSRRDQADSLTHPYIAVALERYDRVSARRGIDLRHPLLSLPLVEFCLSLPWNLKSQDGWTKYIARLASVDVLPEPVRWRRNNRNVMWSFTAKILETESEHVRETIEHGAADLEPFVDMAALRSAMRPTEPTGFWSDNGGVLEAYTLARWLDRGRVRP